jgi:hypothetical protein
LPIASIQQSKLGFCEVAAAGEGRAATLGHIEPGWGAVRLIAPLVLLAAHRSHLRHAVKTLKVEGGLR